MSSRSALTSWDYRYSHISLTLLAFFISSVSISSSIAGFECHLLNPRLFRKSRMDVCANIMVGGKDILSMQSVFQLRWITFFCPSSGNNKCGALNTPSLRGFPSARVNLLFFLRSPRASIPSSTGNMLIIVACEHPAESSSGG